MEFPCPYCGRKFPCEILEVHLRMSCRTNYFGDFMECPFNVCHIIPKAELSYHSQTCKDRDMVLKLKAELSLTSTSTGAGGDAKKEETVEDEVSDGVIRYRGLGTMVGKLPKPSLTPTVVVPKSINLPPERPMQHQSCSLLDRLGGNYDKRKTACSVPPSQQSSSKTSTIQAETNELSSTPSDNSNKSNSKEQPLDFINNSTTTKIVEKDANNNLPSNNKSSGKETLTKPAVTNDEPDDDQAAAVAESSPSRRSIGSSKHLINLKERKRVTAERQRKTMQLMAAESSASGPPNGTKNRRRSKQQQSAKRGGGVNPINNNVCNKGNYVIQLGNTVLTNEETGETETIVNELNIIGMDETDLGIVDYSDSDSDV